MSLELTLIDWAVAVIALTASVFLGLFISLRRYGGRDISSFFLAGRRMLWPVIGASLYSTNIGAEHLVGLSGDAYRYGLCAGTVELVVPICLGFACAVLFPFYIKNKVYTIPEFLEIRYNPTARLVFSGLMLAICIMTKMAFSLFAAALVLKSLLGWDVMWTVTAMGAVTAVFTMVGGFAAVAFTDAIQTAIMIFGCGTMLMIGLHEVGGWEALAQKVPEAVHIAKPYDDPIYPFWGVMAGAVYGGTFYWGVDQVNVQRVLGAENLDQARWGAMFATLLKVTPVFIFALPGVIALALYPGLQGEESKQTFVVLMSRLLPSGIRGLVLAALIAALLSSLNSIMNSISTMVVRDFVNRLRPDLPERTQVAIGRATILVATALGIGAAWLVYRTQEGLYKYLQTISIYLVMPITPAIIFGILSKRVTAMGAAVSVLAGLVLAVVFVLDQTLGGERGEHLFPWLHKTLTLNYTYRGLWGTLIIAAILFAVSAFTRKTDPEKLEKTTINWSGKLEPWRGWSDWRLHWLVLSFLSIVIFAWLW